MEGERQLDDKNLPQEKPPTFIQTVPRCKADMKALMELVDHSEPPVLPVRQTQPNPEFLVGDASVKGFDASKWTQGDSFVHMTYRSWAA